MKINIIGFVVLALRALQCVTSAQTPSNLDPWYSDPGARGHALLSADKSAADVFEVIESLEAVAKTTLETAPFVPLTRSQAEHYAGRVVADDKKHFFLARAVACNVQGIFEVFVAGTDLGIVHGSMGWSSTVRRRAVVVALKVTPTALYSWCSIAR